MLVQGSICMGCSVLESVQRKLFYCRQAAALVLQGALLGARPAGATAGLRAGPA